MQDGAKVGAGEPSPGPWTVFDPGQFGVTYGIEASDGTAVSWYGETSEHGIRRLEDARLCAASWELLQSIRLRHEYEAMPTDRGGNDGQKGKARQRWLDAEKAALQKAGGAA